MKIRPTTILYNALVEIELADGHALHTHEICENLARLGHRVILLCPRPRRPVPYPHAYRVLGVPFRGFALQRKLPHFALGFLYLLAAVLRFRPRFIIDKNTALNPFPELVARLFGLPCIVEINGYAPDEARARGPLYQTIANALERAKLRAANTIVAVSPVLARRLASFYNIHPGKFKTIDNGVADAFLETRDKTNAREKFDLPPRAFIFGYAGSFNADHDMNTIVRAAKIMDSRKADFLFVLAGHGPRRAETEKLVRELGLEPRFRFPGRVDYALVPELYAAFDCALILMTPARADALPSVMKLKEYLASGLPVITNHLPKSSDLKPLVREVPLQDPHAAAQVALEIASAGPRPPSQDARDFVRARYSWRNTAAQYQKALLSPRHHEKP